MAKFLIHILCYTLVTAGLFIGMPYFFAGPYTDAFYLRFTTPKKKSLVIGTSRAAQGIVPEVINRILKEKGKPFDLYNYSFTIKSSPFGEPYLKSILRKIESSTADHERALFIVAVDPWSISTMFMRDGKFEETDFAPNNMRWVDINPNPEYVFKNVDNRLLMILRRFRHHNHPQLMEDGSLKVTVNNPLELEPITNERIKDYAVFMEHNQFSADRFEWLKETLDSLGKRGDCILVRIPVHPKMKDLEEKFMPDFDSRISTLANACQIPYLNFIGMSSDLQSTDGNHLDRKSAVEFSAALAAAIDGKLEVKTK